LLFLLVLLQVRYSNDLTLPAYSTSSCPFLQSPDLALWVFLSAPRASFLSRLNQLRESAALLPQHLLKFDSSTLPPSTLRFAFSRWAVILESSQFVLSSPCCTPKVISINSQLRYSFFQFLIVISLFLHSICFSPHLDSLNFQFAVASCAASRSLHSFPCSIHLPKKISLRLTNLSICLNRISHSIAFHLATLNFQSYS